MPDWNKYPEVKPPKTGDYIVTIDWGDRRTACQSFYNEETLGGFAVDLCSDFGEEVIAWTEMLEPYKG